MVFVHPVADTAFMNAVAVHPTTPRRLAEIKRLVELGEYCVDPYEVADAMIRRAESELEAGRRLRSRAQNECSYPASSPSESVKATPGGPSSTVPIQLIGAWPVGHAV